MFTGDGKPVNTRAESQSEEQDGDVFTMREAQVLFPLEPIISRQRKAIDRLFEKGIVSLVYARLGSYFGSIACLEGPDVFREIRPLNQCSTQDYGSIEPLRDGEAVQAVWVSIVRVHTDVAIESR
jgi:hypothetical protein